MKSQGKKFRLHAKNIFLTYPHSFPLTKNELFEHLKCMLPSWCIVAEEQHADNSTHLHALLGFAIKRDIRSADHFDFKGKHPNTQGIRSVINTIAYVTKEDSNPLRYGAVPGNTKWKEISEATTSTELLQLVRTNYPRDYILQHDRLLSYAQHKYPAETTYIPVHTDFIIPELIKDWINMYLTFPQLERPKSLLLIGPSRLGKTEWARSLGPHMYFNHLMNVDDWNSDSNYIIFDDFGWDYIPAKKCFIGSQKTFTITDKYRKKRTVSWGKPCIILTNDSPTLTPWEELNVQRIFVNTKMF